MTDIIPIKQALLSVSDKAGLDVFAKGLQAHGVKLLSTGGTATLLREGGLTITDVSDHTGFPEMMDGRVKTLHPTIHGGLLALRGDEDHKNAMSKHEISAIDMLVVNLYPFEETLAKGADNATIIENIDIGGPAMLRSAAKNHRFVVVVTDTADYQTLLEEIQHTGGICFKTRQTLAAKAFARTAQYDAAISRWFQDSLKQSAPDKISFAGSLAQSCRYGENPHQSASFYRTSEKRHGIATALQLQGKALSYNNLNDTDAAFELIADLDRTRPTVAIIKHANPCGVATGDTVLEAYQRALACDPVSAFGGIIAINKVLDLPAAKAIADIFTEVIIAPKVESDAARFLAKKKNLRLLETGGLPDPAQGAKMVKSVAGGLLVQDRDTYQITADDIKVVTDRSPSERELSDMLFAFRVAKHVKSNAIVYARDGMTVGIGAGQMNRRDSSRIAAIRAGEAAEIAGADNSFAKGSVVASDAFFPFADGLLAAAEAGATAIIQPGGSLRDEEVIRAANNKGLAMIFTGIRHFRH